MGLRDKAKEAALQSRAKAQRARQQGQAKLAEIRSGREKSALYRSPGEAVYAERRDGGDHAAVDTRLCGAGRALRQSGH